jgi:hypothetical protein
MIFLPLLLIIDNTLKVLHLRTTHGERRRHSVALHPPLGFPNICIEASRVT